LARQPRGQHPVGLFGIRGSEVPGAQPGLDVAHWNVPVEGGQRGAEHRGRVALHEDQVGPAPGKVAVDGFDRARGQPGERLARAHEVEVGVRPDAEDVQDLVEHLAVLGRNADAAVETTVDLEPEDHRGQLDGLRPGAEDH
jgi:hypothetical protein